MGKTKLFFGVAAVLAIMSMNIRHAWMNYGIAENKILAGVVADSQSINASQNQVKQTSGVVYHNLRTDTTIHIYSCITFQTTRYYNLKPNGERYLVATVDINYKEDSRTIRPADADTTKYAFKELDSPATGLFETLEIVCREHLENHVCYPKGHVSDCRILVRQTT